MKIVIDDKIPFVSGVFEPLAEVIYAPGQDIDAAMVKDADALMVRTRTWCNADLLQGSQVKMIATATIGYDHIDRNYCDKHNIQWVNAPGCNAYAVVQYVFVALITLAEREGVNLQDKTLGIVGVGNVGRRIAHFAKKLGMNVLLNDPPREESEGKGDFVSLDTIQHEADIITFHTPLIQEGRYPTYHLCDEHFLRHLERRPILVNAARGEVTDSLALLSVRNAYRALVIDCWEHEPNINLDLLAQADLATFHIAGYSLEGKANAAEASVQAISRFFDLGLNQWGIDLPENKLSEDQDELLQVVAKSYAIEEDDKVFRTDPSRFEYLRGAYHYRREPQCIY